MIRFSFLILLCVVLGCADDVSTPLVDDPVVDDPVVNVPVVDTPGVVDDPVADGGADDVAPVVDDPVDDPVDVPVADDGFCRVGQLLSKGESCKDGTGDIFEVLDNGFGKYLFFQAGQGLQLRGNINGKDRNFVASKQGDGKWKIEAVTPK